MASDRPPPEPRPPGSDLAGRPRSTAAVRDGTLVFALVLGGFVAYALGAPATYRATAVVSVEVLPEAGSVELPKAAEASEKLRRAALDPALVSRLASEERAVPPDTAVQVGTRIASGLGVESRDGRRFNFVTTASSGERAQRVVNELAQQAAKRADAVLDPEPAPQADPGARAKTELLEFLAAHPGIASEPSTTPTRPGRDPLILALRAEKTRIEAKLAEPSVAPVDNPYEEPGALENPQLLRRRLKEIDAALEARSKPPAPPPSSSAKEPSAEVRAEWQRLLRAASETQATEAPKPAAPRLRVTLARAALPSQPITPNRPNVVLAGVIAAAAFGVVAGFLRAMLESRAVRRYGIKTGEYPIAMPQTTLRLSREELPKPLQPTVDAPPTPIPNAPPTNAPMTPIPPAPLVPAPMTPIPPAPLAPTPITPIPAAPIAPIAITPIPPVPSLPATPVPPRTERPSALAPTLIASVKGQEPVAPAAPQASDSGAPGAPLAAASRAATAPTTPTPPGPTAVVLPTPIPPSGVAPPGELVSPMAPLVVQGPSPAGELEGPPTTQAYGTEKPSRPGRGGKRITKIYGTPPTPTLVDEAKALRTTQAYGSPPAAIPPHRPASPPPPRNSPAPFEAELLPPEHKNSLKPAPMIPLSRSSSSMPPPITPATRTGAPLAETSYSYVQTPVPEAQSIPQTPIPRRPSPPPRTEPYGSRPPVQPRTSPTPPTAPQPPPATANAAPVVRTHPVATSWQPGPGLAPARKRPLAAEILTLAVERCLVIGVTAVRGAADKKSIAAAELALALSEAKQPRILLMESDFHFPQVQKRLQIEVPFSAGFSQQLRGRMDGSRDGRWHVVECKPALHVLAEGVMRAPGLLLSNHFEQAMRDLRAYYDIIVIDAPVAPNVADAQAIADVVDGAVVVGPSSRANEIVEVSRIFSGKKLLRVIEG